MLADRISLLREQPQEVRLQLRKEQETQPVFEALREVFSRHRGSCRVLLHLIDSRRVITTEERFWIEATPQSLAELEKVLGTGSVHTA